MTYIPQSGSVVAFQANPSVLQTLTGLMSTNASVITAQGGTIITSIAGIPNVNIASIAGAGLIPLDDNSNNVSPNATANKLPVIGRNTIWFNGNATWERQRQIENAQNANSTGIPAAGLVAQFDDTNPSGVNENNFAPVRMSSVRGLYVNIRDGAGNERGVNVDAANALQVNTGGSVVSFQGGNQITSIVSIIPSSVLVGASIFGQLPGGTATLGSITAIQGTNPYIFTGSVQGTVSVLGTVPVTQASGWVTSLVSTVPSSVIVGTSIFGQLPGGTAVLGSVAALQGTNPWIVNFANASVLAVPVGSIIALNIGSIVSVNIGSIITVAQANSIVGTYAEDAGHTDGDKGVFALAVRNDAVSSMTSAERDYGAPAIDSAGRTIIKPFAGEQACIISYVGSVVSGSVTLIQASVIGSRSYITDFFIANTGSIANLVTFQGGDTSVIGFTIAPGGGGSNAPGIAIPLRTTLSQDLAWKVTANGTISSVIYLTVKGYQAP